MKFTSSSSMAASRRLATLFLSGAFWVLYSSDGARAIVTSDAPGTHTTTPGVPAFGVNVDGVGQMVGNDGSGLCSCTLIGDRHVLTAAHCVENLSVPNLVGMTVRFDLAEGSVPVSVSGVAIHPQYNGNVFLGSDIAVLELAEAAPAVVPRYALYNAADEIGKPTVVVGYGMTGFGGIGADTLDNIKRAGLNRFESTWEVVGPLLDAAPSPGILVFDFDSGQPERDAGMLIGIPDLGFGPDEVGTAPGDSGGPDFVDDNGVFKVAGVHSFGIPTELAGEITSSWGGVSGSTRVSDYVSFINDATSGQIEPVRSIWLNDGAVHQLAAGEAGRIVFVEDSPNGSPTTLESMPEVALAITTRIAASPLAVRDNSVLRITGGSFLGNLYGVDARDLEESDFDENGDFIPGALGHPRVEISGGSFTGSIYGIQASGTLEILGGNFLGTDDEGAGALYEDFSSESVGLATIRGGVFQGGFTGLTASGNLFIEGGEFTGDSRGLANIGNTEIHNGMFTGGSSGADLVFAVGVAYAATVHGGMFTGGETGANFTSVLSFLDAQGQATVLGGAFSGGLDGARGTSVAVEIFGGAFTGDTAGSGDGAGFLADGSSKVEILGGVFHGAFGLLAREEGTVDILGGIFDGTAIDLATADNALIRVLGTSFDQPLGPLSALSGIISGAYRDGTPFELTFDRASGGEISLILVPEPTPVLALFTGGLILLGCLRFGRRSTNPHIGGR